MEVTELLDTIKYLDSTSKINLLLDLIEGVDVMDVLTHLHTSIQPPSLYEIIPQEELEELIKDPEYTLVLFLNGEVIFASNSKDEITDTIFTHVANTGYILQLQLPEDELFLAKELANYFMYVQCYDILGTSNYISLN